MNPANTARAATAWAGVLALLALTLVGALVGKVRLALRRGGGVVVLALGGGR